MAKKENPALKNDSGVYLSQKNASRKYEEKVEQLTLRVPAGTRAILNDYVTAKSKGDEDNPKYNSYNGKAWRPSVNAFIIYLIEQETGFRINGLKD